MATAQQATVGGNNLIQNPKDSIIERFSTESDTKDAGRLTSNLNQIQNLEQQYITEGFEINNRMSIVDDGTRIANSLRSEDISADNALAFYSPPENADAKQYINEQKDNILSALSKIENDMSKDYDDFYAGYRRLVAVFGGGGSFFIGGRDQPSWQRAISDQLGSILAKANLSNCATSDLKTRISSGETSQIFRPSSLEDAISECKSFAGKNIPISAVRDDFIKYLGEVRMSMSSEAKTNEDRLTRISSVKSKIQLAITKLTDTGDKLITFALPSIAAMIIAMIILPRFYTPTVQEKIFSGNMLLEVLTVFLLISSVLILGIADKIPTEALGTLLGGVSGYVLGRATGARPQEGK